MPRSALTWFLAAMLLGLILLTNGCATVQTRDPVAVHRDSNVAVALFAEPCSSAKVLRFIPAEIVADFRSASVLWQGKTLDACWSAIDDGSLIVDETGDSGFIPVKGQRKL
ncbi:MAG: hypothetical protein ACM31O_00035, partial [Bacteroidota bacterium]